MTGPAPSVLLVEDAPTVHALFQSALGAAGFDVAAATTGREALDLPVGRLYAVIVADCFLPDLPPRDWLARLRAAAPTTPVILCSGTLGVDHLRVLAREFRAFGLLQKPFRPGDLVAAVRAASAAAPGGTGPGG